MTDLAAALAAPPRPHPALTRPALTHPAPAGPAARHSGALARLFGAEPRFAVLGLLLAGSLAVTLPALALDARTLDTHSLGGAPIWLKPIKFQVALAVYLLTLAWMARFLPQGMTDGRLYRLFSAAVTVAVVAEIVWIGGAAALGTASHFNLSTPVWAALYPLMGAFAVLLTSASLLYGIAIWRDRAGPLATPLRCAMGLGLILTFVLTVGVASVLSAQEGHFVGVPASGAAVPLFGWSREVGDLRVAHFFAAHALHLVPLAGLAAVRLLPARAALPAVWIAAALYALFVGLVFVQALAGAPFLPA